MGEDQPLAEAVERMDSLIIPSIDTVRTTFDAMKRTVDTVTADCRAVSETLEALTDALHPLTHGDGPGPEWTGFGMIGLPMLGAIRAVKGIAGQYVKQQTGVPLNAWTELVATSSAQFEAYLSQLDAVAELAERHRAPGESEIDREAAQHDLEKLRDVRWRTQAWKQILSRVAQLGRFVDAIVQVNLSGESGTAEVERTSGLSGSLQRRLKEVQSRTVEKSGDLREWLLQPFVEIRDRVRELPAQTQRLSHEVALLELLLELEIAEIRGCLGEISGREARVVGVRVAAGVILPELAEQLAEARQRTQAYQAYLDRLDDRRNAGQVDERVFAVLSEEYLQRLADSRSHLGELEAQADVWRRDGQAVLDACADWTKLELDVLAARELVEQTASGAEHRVLLQREQARLEEARAALATL